MRRSSTIFLLSVIVGLVLPQFSDFFAPYTNLILITLMVFSLKNAKFDKSSIDLRHVQWLFIFSLFAGLVLIFIGSFLITDSEILSGLILWSLMPPAVGIISLSFILKGDVGEALLAEIVSYVVYLFVTPALVFVFLGQTVSVLELFVHLVSLIILPVVIAFFIRNVKTEKYNKLIVELCLALIFYTVIGKNQSFVLSESSMFCVLVLITLGFRFGFFSLMKFVSKRFKFNLSDEKVFVLFSTMKNTGIASVIALTFLSSRALMALGAEILTLPLFIVFLESHYLKKPS
jgi:BASS family bile acid:Na+ symporter